MANKEIPLEELADAIVDTLMKYDQQVTEGVKEEVKAATKECVKELKKNAPKKYGNYKKAWRSKIVFENREDIRCLVYAGPDGYRLAHLLEYGHRLVNTKKEGKRTDTDPRPHIRPAADKAEEMLLGKIKILVKGVKG